MISTTIHVLTTECTNKAHLFSMVVKPESNKITLSLYQIVSLYQAGNTYPRLPPQENKFNNRSIGRNLWSLKLKDSILDFFSLLVSRVHKDIVKSRSYTRSIILERQQVKLNQYVKNNCVNLFQYLQLKPYMHITKTVHYSVKIRPNPINKNVKLE